VSPKETAGRLPASASEILGRSSYLHTTVGTAVINTQTHRTDTGHRGEGDIHHRRRAMQWHGGGYGNSQGDQDSQIQIPEGRATAAIPGVPSEAAEIYNRDPGNYSRTQMEVESHHTGH